MGHVHAKGNLPFLALVTELVAAASVPRETKDRKAIIPVEGDVVPNGKYLKPPAEHKTLEIAAPSVNSTTSSTSQGSSHQRLEDLHKKIDRYERRNQRRYAYIKKLLSCVNPSVEEPEISTSTSYLSEESTREQNRGSSKPDHHLRLARTGKTFIRRTLSAYLRNGGNIVLNVASSGIASLLLPNGRTAHSRFKIPLSINEDSVCNIKQGTPLSKLICKAKLIIWDEAPILSKFYYEALDKSMKDILRFEPSFNADLPFGGKVVVLGGDFGQILPVIPMGSHQDIVQASISSSYLWQFCIVLKLSKNMRLTVGGTIEVDNDLKEIAQWLIQIGDGLAGDSTDSESENLVTFVYLDLLNSDSLCDEEGNMEYEMDAIKTDVLNSINCSCLPNHQLKLKVGVSVMLLRNIDQSNGLCNGTRLQVQRLGSNEDSFLL
ncbi:ATP-dependent DNA helicase PIF1-like [Arachis ipaensis]|uniref:ATP-dependent DNA helicase PIF1-like n=1 Tax=Arachis ipaensis TaxID=130454 RepID=UPI0007AF6179|nr:ATP-dependent DNA helicase PIF1-like [Arachis ipaensis]